MPSVWPGPLGPPGRVPGRRFRQRVTGGGGGSGDGVSAWESK